MHLDDEKLQRVLHGELGTDEAADRAHLDGCTECRQRLAASELEEREIFGLLRRLDHPRPPADVASVLARARRSVGAWRRWAAGIVLAVTIAGGAYAAPGSPVPGWVRQAVAWIEATSGGRSPTVQTPRGAGPAGVALAPGERFTIVFTTTQASGLATLWLTDGPEIVVRRLGGSAAFTADVDGLTIDNGGATADYEIEVPRGAPWVEIALSGHRLWLKDGVRIVGPPVDSIGRYRLPLASVEP